jgi:predicted nuclease of predicted toxin-antitoxin system
VRFLVDLNLSPRLALRLREAGHDALHAADLDLFTTADEQLIEIAREDERFVVSADSDFGTILARTHAQSPSIIFVRRTSGRRVDSLSDLVVANRAALEDELVAGSVVVLGEGVVRVRRLPIL